MKNYCKSLLLLLCLAPACAWTQTFQSNLHVQNCTTGRYWNADSLVRNILLGQGVQVSNVKFNNSTGFINCNAVGTFYTTADSATTNIGLREGILISTGSINGAPGPNTDGRKSTPYTGAPYSDATLASESVVGGQQMYNTSVLEFDFVPQGDSIGFRYVFASEEYPESMFSSYFDIFAFYITGANPAGGQYTNKNIATLPGTNQPVSIGTISPYNNSQFFIDNFGMPNVPADIQMRAHSHIEYDGFTTVMTASVQVVPCSTYHLRICLSDVGDSLADSGVFLEAGSLETKSVKAEVRNTQNTTNPNLIKETCCADLIVRLQNPGSVRRTLQIYRNNQNASDGDYTITPTISGSSNSPSSYTFPAGQDSLVFHICGTIDDLNESIENFRIYYRLQGDCDYKYEPLQIANVRRLSLTLNVPDNSGSTRTITASPGNTGVPPFTYIWTDLYTNQSDTTYSGGSSNKVVPLSPLRQFQVCVIDACGNTTCNTCAVGPTPIFIDTAATTVTVCYNTPATLTAPAGATTYRWYSGTNTNSSSYSTGTSFTTPNITYSRTYTLVGFHDTLGMTWRNYKRYTVTYESLPTLGLSYQGTTLTGTTPTINVCNGQQVTLTGTGGSQYRWGSGAAFTGSTHTFTPSQASSTSSYATTSLQVTAQGPAPRHCLSNPRTVNVHAYKYPTLTPVPDTGICTGNTFNLRARPRTASGVTYWYTQQGSSTRTGQGSTGYWGGITTTASKDYYVHAATGPSQLCQVHDTVHVTVWPLPTLTTSATPQQACSGEVVTLSAQGASSYTWKKNNATVGTGATITVTNTNSSTTATSGTTVTYTLTGTDAHQCVNTKSQTVVVHNVPTPVLTVSPNPICVGSSTTLTARGAQHLSWDSTSWLNQSITTNRTTTRTLSQAGNNVVSVWGYSTLARCNHRTNTTVNVMPYPVVVATADDDSVCAGESTVIRLTGAAEYSLNNTSNFTTSNTFTVTPTGTGTTYTIYGRNAQHMCISSTTIRVGVLQLPSVSLTASATDICQGQSVTLTATGGSSYNWFVGNSTTPLSQHGSTLVMQPTANTSYTVEGVTSGTSPCSSRRTASISVFNYPTLNDVPDTSVCTGNTFHLRARPHQASGVTYWYTLKGSTTQVGQGSTGYWSGLTTTVDTCYVVHASTGPNKLCQRHDSVRVHLWPLPTLTTSATPQQACSGEAVTLSAQGASSYSWKKGTASAGTGATITVTNSNNNTTATSGTTVTYTLTGTDAHQCVNTATQSVVVHNIPTPTLSATPNPICVGSSTTLTARGAQHLSWDSTSWISQSPSTDCITTRTLSQSGSNTLSVWGYSTLARCNRRTNTTVNVMPYPVVVVTADDDSVCAGESTTLRLTGAAEYSLNDSSHFMVTTTFTVTPTGTGATYIVYGRNAQHICISSDTVRVGVLPLPTVSLTPSATDICQGQSVTLTATGGSSYNWFVGNSTTPLSQHGSTLVMQPTAATSYTVEGVTSGDSPCSSRRSVSINVFNYPTLNDVPDTSVCTGNTFHLRARPQQASGVTYWYTLKGSSTPMGQGSIGYWGGLTTAVDTCYVVHASTGPGQLCQRHDSVRVHLWPLPTLTTSATPLQACSGELVTLAAQGATSYVWQKDNATVGAGSSITVSNSNTSTTALPVTYALLGTDQHGCQNDTTQEVYIHSLPVLSTQATPNTLCEGATTTLSASGAQHLSWDSLQWSNTTSVTAMHQLDTARVELFPVWGYNSLLRCNSRADIPVTVLINPSFVLTADDDSVCAGESTMIRVSGNAFEYSLGDTLHFSSDTVFPVTPTGSGTTYTVYGRNVQHRCLNQQSIRIGVLPLPTLTLAASDTVICQGDSVQLTAANSQAYHWRLQGSSQLIDADSGATRYVTPAGTTTYEVEGSNTEGTVRCSSVRQVTVIVYQRPTLTMMADTAICQFQSLALQASATSVTPAVSYSYWGDGQQGSQVRNTASSQVSWPLQTSTPGSHAFAVSAATGPDSLCRAVDTFHLTIWQLPSVVLQLDARELCQADTVTLTAGGAVNYSWNTASGPYQPSAASRLVPAVGTHTYTVYGEDVHGCRNSDTARVIVYDYPSTHLVSDSYDICHGGSVTLTATGAQHYSWDDGSSWVNAANGMAVSHPVLTDSTTLFVEGYNSSPLCQRRDSVWVRVYSYPAVNLSADTDAICLNDTVRLHASGAYQYSWDNGSHWGTVQQMSYVPASAQTQTYTLLGRSEGPGCQSTVQLPVQVYPLPNLQMTVSNDAFCIDTVIDIAATGGYLYRLYSDTATQLPPYSTVSSWQRMPDSSTIYTVDCLTQYNCFATMSHAVTVWTGRFQLFCEDTIVCEHGTVAVSAQGMSEYYWNGSTVPDTHNVYIFTVDTSSDFTVYGRDAHGCHGQETMHVDVYPNPHLQLAADTMGVCVGGTVNILASGAGDYIYHWDSQDSTADSSHAAQVFDTTWFVVTGIEGNLRCSSTDSIQIAAYPLPVVSLTPDRRDICDGDTVYLQASGASRYAWYDNSSYTAAATHADSPVRDTIFTLWGEEDTYHCRNYDTAIVHWFGHPAISIQSDRYNICEGDSVLLTCSGAPYYGWADQSGITSLGSRRVKPDSTTTYHLHGDLRNPLFCGSDTSVTIQVYPIPDVRVHAADTELCYGDTLHLTGSGAAYYAWLADTTHRSVDSASVVLYQSTTLHLSGTIPNRLCYHTDSVSVTVYDPHVRLNPQAWEICNGGTIDVSATGSDRYRWDDDSSFTDSSTHTYAFHSNAATSTQHFLHVTGETANHLCQADTTISIVVYPGPNIHLTIEDLDSIAPRTWEVCAGDSVMFLGTGGYFYQFPGQSSASRTVRHRYHPVPTMADTSVYTLYGENFNHQCSGLDSLTIIVNPLPPVQLTASRQEVCEGDSIRLAAEGATQYSWWADGPYVTADSLRFVRVDSSARYLVYGRDPKLCRQSDTVSVTAYVVPQVYLTASADTICQGFSTTVTAHGASRYAWGSDTAFADSSSCTYTPMHDTVIYVRGCNFNGLCIDADSIRITVLPVPMVQISASREVICWDDTVTLTASCSESTWSWESGAYVSTPLQVWPHDSTIYHIATRAANGCYAYDSILIEVRQFPNVRLHGDEDVCRGDSLLMTATGSSLYSWGTDTSFSTSATRYVSPTNDSLIIVRGTARDSFCRSADTILVRVHDRPILYVDPETTTVCLGDSIVLSASGCDQYRWMEDTAYGWHNGYNVYYPQQSMTYIVTGSMQGGVCVVTAPIVMTVIDTPHVQFTGPLHICLGDSVRLIASGGERYAWESAVQYSASGYFADLPATLGSHTYRVSSQTHTLNCTGRASVSVQVHPVPVVTLTPDDSVLCYGDYVTLSATGAYHYSWDMGLNYGVTSQVTRQPLESYTYTLYGTDSMHLCADTVTQHIVVNPLPVVRLTADTTQFCLGGSVTLTAAGAARYAWNGGSYGTVAMQTDTPLADTLYRLSGIDSNGCLNTDSIFVTLHTPFQNYNNDSHHIVVHRYPEVTASISRANVCLGDSIVLTGHGAQQYRWIDLGNVQGATAGDVPNVDRSYTVVGEMSYGCPDTAAVAVHVFRYPAVHLTSSDSALCEGSPLTLSATGAERYSWDGHTFTTDSTLTFVPPLGENELVVLGATANLLCEAADTIRMHVYPYPQMNIEGNIRWCEGDEVVLAVNNPADTLRWTASPADPSLAGQESFDTLRLHPQRNTIYTVIGTSVICSDTQQHSIVMVPYPELALVTTADRICIGDSITLSATGAELYSWDRLRSYTAADTRLFRPAATAYIPVTGTTYDTLCSVTDSLFIWVDTVPVMSITGPDSGCVGRSIILTAHSGVPVTWSAEPHDSDLDHQQGGFEVAVDPSRDTRYIIEGYSGLCYGSAEHQVVTGIIPKAAGTSLPMHVRRAEADIELVSQCVSEEGYFWIFPDSTQHFGNHYYYNIPASYLADTFLVKIVAYRGGCFDTADVPITISNDEVWTVNAFTPEQATNNRFYVPRVNKENYHLEIFNRRGVLVFESDDPEEGWDGRYQGKLCPMASYVYRVRTSPKHSKEVNYVYGTVTLIR